MVVAIVVVVQCFIRAMSGSKKYFDDYYSKMKYTKDTAEAYAIRVDFPNHLDICNALYGADLEVCIVDSRKWDNPKIGIKGSFLSAISDYVDKLDSDVLLRSDMFTCGCYVVAVDKDSVKSGGEGIGDLSGGIWRSATGTGGSPVFSGYRFFKVNKFPCENCGIPLAIQPTSNFPTHQDNKTGGDFIYTRSYPRSSCVLNPWVSNMTNMFRWMFNATGTEAVNWVNKSTFQKAPCVEQEWLQWVKADENNPGFTFQSTAVFFSGKFKGTTYPMVADKTYILNVLSALRNSMGGQALQQPYFDSNTKIEDINSSSVIGRWSNRALVDGSGVYIPDYETMASYFSRICILNFIDLAKDAIATYIAAGAKPGGSVDNIPTYNEGDEGSSCEGFVTVAGTMDCQCDEEFIPDETSLRYKNKEEAKVGLNELLDDYIKNSPVESENAGSFSGYVVKKGNALFYEVSHAIYSYKKPENWDDDLDKILDDLQQEAEDSIEEEVDAEGNTKYCRSFVIGYKVYLCLETLMYCDGVLVGAQGPISAQCSEENKRICVSKDNRDLLTSIEIPSFKSFMENYFPGSVESSMKTKRFPLTTNSSESCASITNIGNGDIYAAGDK